MSMSRRKAIGISGSTLAGLSLAKLTSEGLQAQAAAQQPAPGRIRSWSGRCGRGSRRHFRSTPTARRQSIPTTAAGPITDPLMWRTSNRQAPEIEFDYRKMAIKVDTRGLGKLTGTLRFSDLEKLPECRRRICCSAARRIREGS